MSDRASLDAASAIRGHHAELHDGLRRRVADLHAAARAGEAHAPARDAVVAYLEAEILPHARAEEATMYRAADGGVTATLVEAMRGEHRDLGARVDEMRSATDAIGAVSGAGAILALFESHLAKENDLLIPALLARPDVSIGELLAGMHELVG